MSDIYIEKSVETDVKNIRVARRNHVTWEGNKYRKHLVNKFNAHKKTGNMTRNLYRRG